MADEASSQNADRPVTRELDFGAADPHKPLTVKDQIDLGTFSLRRWVAVAICAAFVILNGAIMWGIYKALLFDFTMIAAGTPNYERFINGTVVTSLLGATTVQLGAIMYAISQFLFPRSR